MEQLNHLLPSYLCNLAHTFEFSSILDPDHDAPLPSTLSHICSNLTIVTRQNFTHYDMSTGRSPCPSLLFSASGWSCVVCRNLDHGYFHQCTQAILHSSQLPIMYSMLWCATIPLPLLAFFLVFRIQLFCKTASIQLLHLQIKFISKAYIGRIFLPSDVCWYS